eukprot:4681118-Alexandrium_andersonii.AAC.1
MRTTAPRSHAGACSRGPTTFPSSCTTSASSAADTAGLQCPSPQGWLREAVVGCPGAFGG